MRISNQMQNQMLSDNISRSQSAVYEQTERISSGKRLQRASDDATGWARAAELTSLQERLEQFERNSDYLQSQLESVDQTLSTISDILQNASEIAVTASDATLNESDRVAMANEVDQFLEALVLNANNSYGSQYQFGGVANTAPPFEVTRNANGQIDSVTYVGAAISAQINIADGDALPGQMVGGDADNGVLLSDSSDAFAALIEMRDRLANGENLAETNVQNQVDNAFERVIVGRASIGAYLEHISFVDEVRTSQVEQVMTDIATIEDIDLAQAATELSEKQSAYEAALAMTSKTLRTSLLDYL
ncbi:MAG: flagellar hook-associated protein FlgL [Pontiellaceae bacterium]|nr:flagellar hook-associated protein FlgL [Pontiellaceae bacterium]MBN2784138.1 flagellar hook-associated protein FlgL [Pontiellaceae bacterium]